MKIYIDGEKLMESFYDTPESARSWSRAWWLINHAKLADVRENVRGEWLSGDCMGASCSKCGEYFSFRTFSEVHNFNFCPNCGADMRRGTT